MVGNLFFSLFLVIFNVICLGIGQINLLVMIFWFALGCDGNFIFLYQTAMDMCFAGVFGMG